MAYYKTLIEVTNLDRLPSKRALSEHSNIQTFFRGVPS